MTRRRYVFRRNPETGELHAVEVTDDWTDAERRAPTPTEALTYSNLQATDGTPIDSRRKHAEYMKRNNLALSSDFSEQTRQRDKVVAEQQESRERRETIGRALYTLEKGGERLGQQLRAREQRREAIWRDIERKGR